jgi:hypothetical protein
MPTGPKLGVNKRMRIKANEMDALCLIIVNNIVINYETTSIYQYIHMFIYIVSPMIYCL